MVIKEVPDPRVGPRDALIRVHACGVCHTDLHVADGLIAAMGFPAPSILGHEVGGVVEAVGDEVTHIAPGDRVGVYWIYGCGLCPFCVSGEEEVCAQAPMAGISGADGGYADLVAVPAANVIRLPSELTFVDAAPLFCGGLTVYGALKNAGLRSGQRVAVLGIGGQGHLALAIARAMGAEVIALTSTAAKEDLARRMGAHHVITGEGLGQRLHEMGGADVILSTTIDTHAIIQVLPGLRPLGTLVLTGITMEPLPIVPFPLLAQQQRVIGSKAGSRADMRDLLQLAASHGIRPLTQTYALAEVNTVHEQLATNKVGFRAVLTPV
jgi:D-arabinose 1-dehydrogenase-like Zn-dependent alcohol dehydrogenase